MMEKQDILRLFPFYLDMPNQAQQKILRTVGLKRIRANTMVLNEVILYIYLPKYIHSPLFNFRTEPLMPGKRKRLDG